MVYRTRGRFIGRITANQLRFHLDPSNLMTREKAKPTVYIIFQPLVDVTPFLSVIIEAAIIVNREFHESIAFRKTVPPRNPSGI